MTHAFGFFFQNGTVLYHLVSVSKLFKEPAQEPGAQKFRNGHSFGSSKRRNRLGSWNLICLP